MTENLYTQYANKYYNPNDDGKKPGDNENWESIQKGFYKIGTSQLETTGGLTLGKGTADETSVTAAELEELKNPTQLETSGGLTLGKDTADETSVTAAELEELKNPTQLETSGGLTLGKGTADETSVTAAELINLLNVGTSDVIIISASSLTIGSINADEFKDVNINPTISNSTNEKRRYEVYALAPFSSNYYKTLILPGLTGQNAVILDANTSGTCRINLVAINLSGATQNISTTIPITYIAIGREQL